MISLPYVKQALVDGLTLLPSFAGVTVAYSADDFAPPVGDFDRFTFGRRETETGATIDFEPGAISSARATTATYAVYAIIDAVRTTSAGTQFAADTAAVALLEAVRAFIADDPTLGIDFVAIGLERLTVRLDSADILSGVVASTGVGAKQGHGTSIELDLTVIAQGAC